MIVSLASYAFFNQMLQMGQQMAQAPQQMMGSMMMANQNKPCDCRCPQPK
jgi:hypothetical protein